MTLADPFIMLYHNTYYAYGTNSDEGIEVYTSNDLREWKLKGLALNKKDVWGERWFWAPEVYEIMVCFICTLLRMNIFVSLLQILH